ncbi:MAG TPA: IS21 family transposase [Marinobacter sp.]|uniref:Integrase catalytic domain-containing protein n=1 Tax=marine sediment metagenome TaxID=412755 RepID=A0A0F9KUR8_9ZZZZ|nr:IS21 family transposase [Marinobacter sp.]
MLSKEDFVVIKALKRRGVYQKDIAEQLGVHAKTVSRALKRGEATQGTRKCRVRKLDSFKATVNRLLSEGVWNAVVILREIQEQGYSGGYTMLLEYIAPKRALRAGRQTVRFETKPGQQLQSDWGEITTVMAGCEIKVSFIVNELGYSRRFHFWCADSQDAEHTYEGLVRSFEYLGGTVEEVLVDNQKTAVLEHPVKGTVRFNERFLDLALHYGFSPRACRPYRARTKGKCERMVGYIKQHFFQRYRVFESWAHLNQLAEQWLHDEADQRMHGTVKEIVAARFAQELPALGPLPAQRYDTAYRETRHVSWDGYVDVRGNRYSVPSHLAGKTVTVRIGLDGTLRIFHGEELAATHMLRHASQGWVTVPDHHRELWRNTLQVERRSLDVYEEAATWS